MHENILKSDCKDLMAQGGIRLDLELLVRIIARVLAELINSGEIDLAVKDVTRTGLGAEICSTDTRNTDTRNTDLHKMEMSSMELRGTELHKMEMRSTELRNTKMCNTEIRTTLEGRKVICLEDLSNIEAGVLELDKNSVVTPLARDYLKDKGIKLLYK